jgi:hypothetical protein
MDWAYKHIKQQYIHFTNKIYEKTINALRTINSLPGSSC